MTTDTLFVLGTLVGARLRERGLVLACAESCTGGWVAQTVTAVAGSSAWFDRGFVTYSNQAKQEMLGVPAALLEQHGAVSEATAQAMAQGALTYSQAHVALSVTGVAGPSGGTAEKPVGIVCFGWARAGGQERVETRRFDGDREAVRRQSVIHALQGVLALLQS
jgi:nicotinamide-nucleotide amidase